MSNMRAVLLAGLISIQFVAAAPHNLIYHEPCSTAPCTSPTWTTPNISKLVPNLLHNLPTCATLISILTPLKSLPLSLISVIFLLSSLLIVYIRLKRKEEDEYQDTILVISIGCAVFETWCTGHWELMSIFMTCGLWGGLLVSLGGHWVGRLLKGKSGSGNSEEREEKFREETAEGYA